MNQCWGSSYRGEVRHGYQVPWGHQLALDTNKLPDSTKGNAAMTGTICGQRAHRPVRERENPARECESIARVSRDRETGCWGSRRWPDGKGQSNTLEEWKTVCQTEQEREATDAPGRGRSWCKGILYPGTGQQLKMPGAWSVCWRLVTGDSGPQGEGPWRPGQGICTVFCR